MPPQMSLSPRDVSSTLSSVKSTFSSWDSCMSKAYCKWPVIVVIIVVSCIAISLLWCCFRCIFCGAKCCCCAARCCGCGGGGKRRHRRVESPPPQPLNAQYQPPPPMYAGPVPGPGYMSAQKDVAQFATFDTPTKDGKFNEDALPAMPSWGEAVSKKVEVEVKEEPVGHEKDDMEMQKLDTKGQSTPSLTQTNGAGTPVMSSMRNSPAPDRGFSAPGQPQQPSFSNGDLATPQSYHTMHEFHAGQDHDGYNTQQGYGANMASMPQPHGQSYFHADDPYGQHYDMDHGQNGYGQAYGDRHSPPSVNGYAPTGYAPSGSTMFEPPSVHQDPHQHTMSPVQGYPDPYQRSFSPAHDPYHQSPSPVHDPYSQSQPHHNDPYQRTMSPANTAFSQSRSPVQARASPFQTFQPSSSPMPEPYQTSRSPVHDPYQQAHMPVNNSVPSALSPAQPQSQWQNQQPSGYSAHGGWREV